ncbi:MAG: acyl-CoA dehydrogenase C-terminal domain-containing protein [Rickettsiales bacterium]
MPTYKAPLKDFEFIIKDYLKLSQYNDLPGFADSEALAMPLLEEGAKFCENILFPINQSGDAEGCTYENGTVRMPKGFKEAYAQYVGGGWPSFTCNTEWGGQGLPEVLNMPITEMICSANLSFGLTPGLSHSAYNLMEKYCPAELKPRFMPKLVSGEWAGVMCLTEPQAGTDLGLIRTKAEPVGDGTYKITGNKIFISSGEQDLTENIVHLVLAKLPDAPKGSRGISLFLVSKLNVKEDGSLGERNAVHCAGIEHKMGIHGSSTCVINYDGALGYLIGEPHRGLPAMFAMMNAARIYVGVQGLGLVEVAYQNALAYANERLQGRALTGAKQPEKPADPILVHPDVRKMLLTQRANAEAGRALVMLTALKHDIAHRHPDAAVREAADDFVQLITPIVKAHLTDLGFEMSSLGMQCFGGYGYIKEYGAEQYVRDARIAMIYEGTNGVQAMDLVGRKLPHRFGRYLRAFFHPAFHFITENKSRPEMAEFLKPLEKHVGYLQQASLWLAQKGLSNPNDAAAGSVEYLRLFAQVVFAWIWAEQASIALAKLSAKEGDQEFYKQKVDLARFYYARILPGSVGLLASLTQGSKTIMDAELKAS